MTLAGGLATAVLGDDTTADDTSSAPATGADNSAPSDSGPSQTADSDSQPSQSADSDQGSNFQVLAQPDTSELPQTSTSLSQAFGSASTPNVANPSQPPPPAGLKGLGGHLRGVLYGLATGGPIGGVAGAIDPNNAQRIYQERQQRAQAATSMAQSQAASAAQNLQFESVRAADSHIAAMKQAQNADLLNEEGRIGLAQKGAEFASYLRDNFGAHVDIPISGNGQEVHDQAIAAHTTLADENGGQIPPVFSSVIPHTPDQPAFKINVYAPSADDLARNQAGFRNLVDTQRAVQGLPPIDDTSWNSSGFKGQREMALGAMKYLSPIQTFDESNIGSVLAQRKQLLAAYQNHTDASGNPD